MDSGVLWLPHVSRKVESSRSHNVYECVDKNPESVPGSAPNTNGAFFYTIEKNSLVLFVPNRDCKVLSVLVVYLRQ